MCHLKFLGTFWSYALGAPIIWCFALYVCIPQAPPLRAGCWSECLTLASALPIAGAEHTPPEQRSMLGSVSQPSLILRLVLGQLHATIELLVIHTKEWLANGTPWAKYEGMASSMNNAAMAAFGIFVHPQNQRRHSPSTRDCIPHRSFQCLPFEFLCLSQGIRLPNQHILNLRLCSRDSCGRERCQLRIPAILAPALIVSPLVETEPASYHQSFHCRHTLTHTHGLHRLIPECLIHH